MQTTLSTPAGPLTVLLHGPAVLAAGFTRDAGALWPLVHPGLRPGGADSDGTAGGTTAGDVELVAKAVAAYFAGDLAAIDAVAVHQAAGGDFLVPAWAALRAVAPGAPVTYREFAARTGRPAAVRAAAMACARNAAALFVPCHRVVRTDGGLGGYRWGVEIKRLLLAHERDTVAHGTVPAGETHS